MDVVYEQCRASLEQLTSWYQQHVDNRNEATTRLHLIDSLFCKCLSWTTGDITAEEPHGKQYADYTFFAPRRVMIVEAKREGQYFEVPAGMPGLEYSLQTLSRDNPELRAALEQAAGYCQSRGVPIGVVCNGHQLVAFIATRNDGVPPLEGRALVFVALEAMIESFLELWDCLSKPGIAENNLQKRLLSDRSLEVPPKLSSLISGYPGVKQRNIFQTDLQVVSDLVLEDIARSPGLEKRFLTECYCQSGALSQYAVVSRNILKARYAELFSSESPGPTVVDAVDKGGESQKLLVESVSRRPVLIIGDVGVGKTMFIQHHRKVDAADLFKDMIVLYIDLGTQATLTADLHEFILDEISAQLLSEYGIDVQERNFIRGVFHDDLERFSRGLYSDLRENNPALFREKEIEFLEERVENTQEHLRRSVNHIVWGRETPVAIFIDNADQREDVTQQQAFLISQELAEHWPVTVFVTLRPETFHRSRRSGALSGYHPKAFSISPPRVDRVLEKRLGFALRIASGEITVRGLEGVRVRLRTLETVMRPFLDTIIARRELIEFIDNISGGNIRVALDLVRGFFASGHVDTKKIASIYSEQGRYTVPLHEFLRAVIFGDSVYYDPHESILANLYDVSHYDPKEHFLLPILLSVLVSAANQATGEGFIGTARLYEHAQGLGFTPSQIDAAIVRGSTYRLIEGTARSRPGSDLSMPIAFRATTVGAYHIKYLCRLFSYFDAMTVDTPIFDRDAREAIQDVHSITERLERAEHFRSYLDQQWIPLGAGGTAFLWPDVSQALARQIAGIRIRVEPG